MTERLNPAEAGALFARLREVFGERVTATAAIRANHAEDEGYHAHGEPDFVAFPATTEEVSQAVRLCAAASCPVVPWGAGTSLEGNALSVEGGLCLDLSAMNAIVSVESEDLSVTVQAGVRRLQLNAHLKGTGLFFPIDPGADATLGGMAATRASGTNAVRYGTMRTNVLACVVVLADGRIIRTAQRAPKSSAGYDLTALLVGSEGTLGIITELTVRLHPLPEAISALVCTFETVGEAVQSVIAAIQMGVMVARIEFLDAPMMAALNKFEKASYAEKPTLFVEFSGSPAAVVEQMASFEEIMTDLGGHGVQRATQTEERNALWKARHNALYATKALSPGKKLMITDVCVPISRLADCLTATRADLDASSLTSTIAGHVGDGNFHAFIVVDPEDAAQLEEAEALHQRMARRAISMAGTCTGEHGIGLGKRELLAEELGGGVAVMASVKAALDPAGLLNPGKIFASVA